MFWKKKKKKEKEIRITNHRELNPYDVVKFVLVNDKQFKHRVIVDNIIFASFIDASHANCTIHLIDGKEKLLVYQHGYDYLSPNGKIGWIHEGSWCDRIIQIINDFKQKQEEERIESLRQSEIEEREAEIRLEQMKEKFNKMFSGDTNER